MERAQRPNDPWSGHISLPGGRRENYDRDRLDTAIRETWEETGVRLQRTDLIAALDDLQPRTPTYPNISVRPFVFALPKKPKVRPGPEAVSCFWVNLRSLMQKAGIATVQIADRPAQVPAFRIGKRLVWGITYRILDGLLRIGAGD
jgi:8-oxo-dGTP pyrophosphatase MutT (NUDIX family)